MTADAEPVKDLSRVEIDTLFVFSIIRIALILVTDGALLKLLSQGDVLDRVVTPGAGDTGDCFVRKSGIGIYLGLVTLMVEQHQSAPAVRVEADS